MDKYFKILGLKSDATLEEIKSAYRDLVKVWHPDRFSHDPKLQIKAQEKLKEINEAYEFLSKFYPNNRPSQENSSPSKDDPTTYNQPSHSHNGKGDSESGIRPKLLFTKWFLKNIVWLLLVAPIVFAVVYGVSNKFYKNPPSLTPAQVLDGLDFLIPLAFPHVENDYLSPVFSYTPKIEIKGPIDEYSIVAVNPPYREFPNILIFKFNFKENKWKRIREGVSLGVSLPNEKSVDLHVAGIAVDFLKDESAKKNSALKDYYLSNGFIVTEYDKFVHTHMGGRELYTINRSEFPKIARALLGAPYTALDLIDIEDNTCKAYDTPKLEEISFSKINNRYVVVGITENNQKWTLSFIDTDELIILGRNLSAERYKVY